MGIPFVLVEGTVSIVGPDGSLVEVLDVDGKKALNTTGNFAIDKIYGFDNFADTWFFIKDTGDINTIWRIEIAVGTHDVTVPADNDPAVLVDIIVTSLELKDEEALRDKIVSSLNNDANFNIAWSAKIIQDNHGIHIQSKRIAERGERFTAGDFLVSHPTSNGTPIFSSDLIDYTFIIRRKKQNSGARDPRDPRFLTVGISGEVQAVPGAVSDLYDNSLQNNGSPDLRVDGSVTPVEFLIEPDLEKDIFIKELRFYGGGNGISFTTFLNKNSPLDNGILVEIRSNEEFISFSPIKTTEDFKNKWSFGSGSNFSLDLVSGTDQFLAVLLFENPFPIKRLGTFITGEDYVKCFIRDNLSSQIAELEIRAFGFLKAV